MAATAQPGAPRGRRRLSRASVALASTLLSLLLAEVAVRLFVPVRNVGPAFTVYDPVYLRRLKRDASIVSSSPEFRWRLTTNSRGLRDPERAVDPDGALLFLGDSFTMGYGVNDGEEFPRLIDAELANRFGPERYPVVNAGIGNAGNGHWVKFLRRDAPRYAPRFVVLQVCPNDFGDNVRERLFTLAPTGRLAELRVDGPSWIRRAQSVVEAIPGLSSSHLFAFIKQAALGRARFRRAADDPEEDLTPTATLGPDQKLTFALVDEALRLCQRAGWPTLVLNVGVGGRMLEELRGRCRAYGTKVLTAPTKRERPDLYYEIDGHWRAAGHRFTAGLVLSELLRDARFTTPRPSPRR